MKRRTQLALGMCLCILAASFFFVPVIYMVIVPCNTNGYAYVSPSYYLFNGGGVYFPEGGHYAWLTQGPIDCI
jgi:hypothetical protein